MTVLPTRRGDTVETLHGHRVADPYRWLEDPDSQETRDWVAAQNAATGEHLASLASRPWFQATMRAVTERPRAGTPRKLGGRYVVSRNDGTQQQDVWFVADTLEELRAGGRVLLDPNTFSDDGTSSLAGLSASRSPDEDQASGQHGRWLAYQVSDGGSDWTSVRLLEAATGREVDDVVTKVKFSDVTWLPDDSYLYLHFPTEGSGVGTESAALPGGRLCRHRVGESQDTDELVLSFPDEPQLFLTPSLSRDGRWLSVQLSEGTSEHNRLWVHPITWSSGALVVGEPLKLVDEPLAAFHPVRTDGSDLYLVTDLDAPLRRLVRVDLEAVAAGSAPELVDVLPEGEHLLDHATAAGDGLLVLHLVDALPRLSRCSLTGGLSPVELPTGSVVALHAEQGDSEAFVGLSTVTQPTASYRLDLVAAGSDGSELTALDLAPEAAGTWDPPEVVVERHRATSADGTLVPYFLVRPASAPPGPRPTLLWGYGGFNISETPSYRAFYAGWLAAGGTLVLANLRGGGEYGAAWHDAGRLERKQNVFDDLVAVGEHLLDQRATTSAQLALHGRSNGGLLVGAVLTQRPDLAAVALPAVGVLDMLRFHLFTVGAAWISDYGSPDDPAMFEVLRAYSPVHNVVAGTAYPATLVLTGDHDDRVVPAHSFKLTAALQAAQSADLPVLARIETAAGHGAGKPMAMVAAEAADMLAFAAEHTGLVPPHDG